MSTNSIDMLNEKEQFVFDFYFLVQSMEFGGNNPRARDERNETLIGGILCILLLQWGPTGREIGRVAQNFDEKAKNNQLDFHLEPYLKRIFGFIKDDQELKERLLLQLLIIGIWDETISDQERSFFEFFKENFGISFDEYTALGARAQNWVDAINKLGEIYIQIGKKQK